MDGQMYKWMDTGMDGGMNGWIDGWKKGYMSEQMDVIYEGYTGWMNDGWLFTQMDVWMDG